MIDETATEDIRLTINPLIWISWILSLPLRFFTFVVVSYRRHQLKNYDPTKDPCPACGFRGDKGTAGAACRVQTRKTMGPEKLGLWHECYRCSAEYWTNILTKADAWYREPIPDPRPRS